MGAKFFEPCFEGWSKCRKSVATSDELLRRIFHPGDLHKDIGEFRWIALLLAIIA